MIHPICHGTENNGTTAPQYLHVFLDYFFQQATPQAPWLMPQALLHRVLNEKTQTWINGMEKTYQTKITEYFHSALSTSCLFSVRNRSSNIT